MPILSVRSDPASLTLTATGEYPVPVARLWAAWANPREIERFWGPPQWPATFTRHDMSKGGSSEYYMSGPAGETVWGYWTFVSVNAPHGFEVLDGFANPDGSPNTEIAATRMSFTLSATPSGSRFVAISTFASIEAMERLIGMGMLEGLNEALAQLDEVLADLREHAHTFRTELKTVDETHAVVTRDVRGSLHQVWRAHTEAALMQQWMLGPDGWTMPVCEVAANVGDSYRYEWERGEDGARFGFTGELLESSAPLRAVTTERMNGVDGPGTVNELCLSPRPGGRTRIEVRITYPTQELRDMILGTGMVDGMETSYARLERVVLDK